MVASGVPLFHGVISSSPYSISHHHDENRFPEINRYRGQGASRAVIIEPGWVKLVSRKVHLFFFSVISSRRHGFRYASIRIPFSFSIENSQAGKKTPLFFPFSVLKSSSKADKL